MPKFYCEYCGIYLTHSSPSGRSQHAKGRKHINNRIEYYKQVIEDINKENSDKLKQMQSGSSMSAQPQPLYPGAFQNLNQLPLQQLQQLKAGGIQQVQISSNQQGSAPPVQPPLPILQPPFINMPKPGGPGMPPPIMPPGVGIPPLRPGQPPLGPPPIGMIPPNPNMMPPMMPPGGMKPLPGMMPMGPPMGMMPPPGAPPGMMGMPPNMPPMGMMPPPHHLGGPFNPQGMEMNKGGELDDKN